MAELNLLQTVQVYSRMAVNVAHERYRVRLDYSVASIEQLEHLLDSIYRTLHSVVARFLRGKRDPDEVARMAMVWGAYLGEVMRRHHGGEWIVAPVFGPDDDPVLTLKIGDTSLFPPAKVHKRLTNGAEDNVWYYYQVLEKDLLVKDPGAGASGV